MRVNVVDLSLTRTNVAFDCLLLRTDHGITGHVHRAVRLIIYTGRLNSSSLSSSSSWRHFYRAAAVGRYGRGAVVKITRGCPRAGARPLRRAAPAC